MPALDIPFQLRRCCSAEGSLPLSILAQTAELHGCSTLASHQVDHISQELVEAGFSYSGKDFLHSGITGGAGPGRLSQARRRGWCHKNIHRMHALSC